MGIARRLIAASRPGGCRSAALVLARRHPDRVFYQTAEPPAGLWLRSGRAPIAVAAEGGPIREAIRDRALADGFDALGFAALASPTRCATGFTISSPAAITATSVGSPAPPSGAATHGHYGPRRERLLCSALIICPRTIRWRWPTIARPAPCPSMPAGTIIRHLEGGSRGSQLDRGAMAGRA